MTVYKLIEIVGTSPTGVDDAIRGAIQRASTTLDGLQWFEVKEIRGRINEANAPEYQVKIHLGFRLHAPDDIEEIQAQQGGKEPTTRATRSKAAQIAAKGGEKRRDDLALNFEQQEEK